MANRTSIEWTDRSANPLRARRVDGKHRVPGHFCQKISPGCANCYSSGFQPRFGLPLFPGTSKSPADMGVEVYLDQKVLQSLLRVRKPCKIFLCDMTDLFGDWVPFEWIDQIFAVMALTPHLTYQILTKRPERMAEYLNTPDRAEKIYGDFYISTRDGPFGKHYRRELKFGGVDPNYHNSHILARKNWWLGTSVEDQKRADERIPHLLKCPAAIRFLSCEPLLGPVDVRDYLEFVTKVEGCLDSANPIHWLIAGGESGHNARPVHPDWVRSLRDQCASTCTDFFFKQWGQWEPTKYDASIGWLPPILVEGHTPRGHDWGNGQVSYCVGKKAAGRLLDGVEHNAMPATAMGGIA